MATGIKLRGAKEAKLQQSFSRWRILKTNSKEEKKIMEKIRLQEAIIEFGGSHLFEFDTYLYRYLVGTYQKSHISFICIAGTPNYKGSVQKIIDEACSEAEIYNQTKVVRRYLLVTYYSRYLREFFYTVGGSSRYKIFYR